MARSGKNILIVQIDPPQDMNAGDYYYRSYAPGVAMARHPGVYVVNLTSQHWKRAEITHKADILILKGIADPDLFPLIRKRKAERKVTLFEISDDFATVPPWNPVYCFYRNHENLSLLFKLASRCDAIQYSCPELKRLYGHLQARGVVFPNQILEIPKSSRRKKQLPIVVGWGGSHGHLEDVKTVVQPLSTWIMAQSDVLLAIMGSEEIWRLFDSIPPEKKRYTPPGEMSDYYEFLQILDIGFAPLNDTPFNRARSDVKFLEYGVSEVVPIVQNLEPYRHTVQHGETGFLFSNSKELVRILTRLIRSPEQRVQIARKAREYVITHRNQMEHGGVRVEYYLSLIEQNDGVSEEAPKSFSEWCSLPGAERNGRYLKLLPTRFEALIHDGLVAMQMEKDRGLALKLLQEAITLHPKLYFPYLYAAVVANDPIRYLLKAVDLEPASLRAWILLGEEFARQGQITEALHCFETAAQIDPEYEIPFVRAASVLRTCGAQEKATHLIEKANQLAVI